MTTMKLHWPAVLGVLTTLAGVASSPAVLGVLPAKWAVVVTTTGALIQALTKALHDGKP